MLHNKWYIKLRLFPKRRLKQLLATHVPHPFQPNRSSLEALLAEFDPSVFTDDGFARFKEIIISTPFTSIDIYTKKLIEARVMVVTQKPIEYTWMSSSVVKIGLDSFFIDKENFYMDKLSALQEFKKEASAYCEALRPADTEASGVYEHNNRMLTKLTNSLQDVIHKLLTLSTELK